MMDEDDADYERATRGIDEVDVLDSRGDLHLQVGGDVEKQPKTYLVCSKSLARVSTVFEKMLYGGFAESRPTDTAYRRWTVELPDDRLEPTELLLHIAHGRFDRVPEQLELTRLYQFLVVIDKYDAAGATRPWARGWLEFVQEATLNPLLLGVAYELGHLPTFEIMMRKISDECLVDDDGDLVFGFAGDNREAYSYKLRNIEYLVPPGLLEDTASTRMKLLTTMLEPYASLYATLKHGDRCQSSPQDPTSGRRCDSILLGSLIRSFAAQGIDLAAPDPAAAYRGSAATLQAILPRLELYTSQHPGVLMTLPSSPLPSPFGQPPLPHFEFAPAACEQELEAALRDGLERSLVLKGQVIFSQPRHGEYLWKQASKTGLTK
ncbi:uncharacterized protein LY79DRAFT_591828 [Colletotrichum navitas]|uniref:Nuclear pore protein n=1 Tax=Colletotrichum navitas TaxID=681940 RepID=A0AAD8PUI8_9PEZI|nr:uncharacterized protein LY79DRAFT_591828 [Colletotrichum navitas]KAK1584972.1 hypothetical protein LY79DRAFT_591828 [Colletotrichum navitas]